MTPHLFVSLHAYVMGKCEDDMSAAVRDELAAGEGASWPGFRTLARVRAVAHPIVLQVTHSSLIAKARSLALGAFLESAAPRWLSIDDDVDASAEDVAKLLAAGDDDVDVLVAPCALRGGDPPELNIVVSASAGEVRDVGAGVRAFPIDSGGAALSLVTRHAARWLDDQYGRLRFVDRDGARGLGVFLEQVEGGAWYGEDFAFCRRARACGLRIDALCETTVTHAGVMATVDPKFFTRPRSAS
jgi:hypothetical protein